MGRGRIGSLAV